jgi:leader peptidase (prepilin peptidase)/N-methyltransferase
MGPPPWMWFAVLGPVGALTAVAVGARVSFTAAAGDARPLTASQRVWLIGVSAVGLGAVGAASDGLVEGLSYLAAFSVLICLAVIDLRFLVVPVWPCLGLIGAGVAHAGAQGGIPAVLWCGLSALLTWLAFRALDLLYQRLRGRSGLGAGDALVAAAIASWSSLTDVAWATAFGCSATLAWLLTFGRRERDFSAAFALAPGLVFGAFAVVLGRWLLGVL